MSGFDMPLTNYEKVKEHAVVIYHALHSRAMPLTGDPAQYWPDDALETLRRWINQGCRRTDDDPLRHSNILPEPVERPVRLRMRRDILSLSPDELNDYRARLDDGLRAGDPASDAPWQRLASVHGDWCLHYQEAFLFWHRAYLMRFEQMIDCPVPYWNWYAVTASRDGRPGSGLPQAFVDETYVHPRTGEVRPNPLRFAAARGGRGKACANTSGTDCRWVRRDPVLYTTGDEQRAARQRKLGLLRLFQDQVTRALRFDLFSTPQGWPGYPWANIQSFDPPPPDTDYPYRTETFDGAYEQPHDNFHGWIGPDMADNSYTAFDPVFWSYHANIDRIFEIWLRAHPAATYTAGFPIHPFAGPTAGRFEFDDPRRFVYTTIGDLAKDSRALGYDYAPPEMPDISGPHAAPPTALSAPATGEPALEIVFDGVRCTFDSYGIDLFLNQEEATADDAHTDNPHYVGRATRIGMGAADDKGRCIAVGVRRVTDATATARRLGLKPGDDIRLTQVVTDLATGALLTATEYDRLPGFAGRPVWRGGSPPNPDVTPAGRQADAGECCAAITPASTPKPHSNDREDS